VPLTYGGNVHYKDKIVRKLNSMDYQFTVLTSFLNDRQVAMLRKASDYFINLQITDQLSGSMLEHLYAGSTVLTGSWLPYNILDGLGIRLLKVNDVPQAAKVIKDHLLNGKTDDSEMNGKLIYDFSYWGNCIKSWNDLYKDKIINPQ
jgi:hypothetical protein